MYIPDLFKNENQEEIRQFLNENGFAILINQTNGKLWGTHTPLFLEVASDNSVVLGGHIARENPQAVHFKDGQEVLAIFNGPHTYISPSWYDHENVPTWNYIAVHVYGKLRLLDYDESVASLIKLVNKYEKNQENPMRVEELSRKTMMQARGILAFEINVTEIQAVKKMSQNRDDKNYKNIIGHLEKSGRTDDQEVADEMRKNRTNL
ncbi:FMN-binding negative transcriptional regulator [Flavobacterium amniphilum]|uniref:FMN-binding negative transcriptional regulator n=1 Tax=Flavobacterium amniphilum TaxID=1834035 RepID=UPI002029F3BC|nr:FMN-binding negative transcriptional regulator [Flavobacterium amniphilum]MCL9805068.1 FMN-binding negative transcriptional regulator [Flavobacterium amniphilum]